MKNESLVLKSSREIDIAENQIDDWQRVGEILIPIVYRGNPDAVMQIVFQSKHPSSIRISGGTLYSDSAAVNPLPNEIDITAENWENKSYFFKVKKDAILAFRGVTRWGVADASTTAPFIKPLIASADNPYPIINLEDISTTNYANFTSTSFKGNVERVDMFQNITRLVLEDGNVDKQELYGTLINPVIISYLTLNTKSPCVFMTEALGRTINIIDNRGTVQGNIKNLQNLTLIRSTPYGNNKLYGDLADFNDKMTEIYVHSAGIFGDISSLRSKVLSTLILDTTASLTYSQSRVWADTMRTVQITKSKMATADIDRLLIDLSMVSWTGVKTITLRGSRTAASDGAVSVLINKGVTISFNIYG